MMGMSLQKVFIVSVWLIAVASLSSDASRSRRSPFKKHKIIFTENTEGWTEPLPQPPPPIVIPQPDHTIVDHHHHHDHHTIVDHHHHHHVDYQYPPRQHYTRIEISKGKGKDELKEKLEELEAAKKANLEAMKASAEAKLEKLAEIPHKIASDLDFIGSKIKEGIEKEHSKSKGISINVWKGKGTHVGPPRPGTGSSTEVHHHHHYHGSSQESQRGETGSYEGGYRVPKPKPPPPPPSRTYDQYYDHNKFADVHTLFTDFLEVSRDQFRMPTQESTGTDYGKGKGFSLNIWKSKGGRRRK